MLYPHPSQLMSAQGQLLGCVWQHSRSHGVLHLPIQLRHGLGGSSGTQGSRLQGSSAAAKSSLTAPPPCYDATATPTGSTSVQVNMNSSS